MDKNSITIKNARKMLGRLAENISDNELDEEIQTAKLLKDLFFAINARHKKSKNM